MTLSNLSILTHRKVVIRDDDMVDIVRCTEINSEPRMHVVVEGARLTIITTVNSQTCHIHVKRAALTGRLVQCEVVQYVDCTTCSHKPL